LDEVLKTDTESATRIRAHFHRSQLFRYRSGRGRPSAEAIVWLDAVTGGVVAATGWSAAADRAAE
jgi:hypothetical protein